MSLGDHLEELRMRLILAIMGLVVGAVFCLIFTNRIIRIIEGPYMRVAAKSLPKTPPSFDEEGVGQLIETYLANLSTGLASDSNAPDMDPAIVRFLQAVWIPTFEQFKKDWNVRQSKLARPQIQLQTLAPADGFINYIKIALVSGLLLSSPWVFYQIWMFVAAGLYAHERNFVHKAAPFSAGLFVAGALFFLLLVAPLTIGFLVQFNQHVLNLSSNFTFKAYISFVTMLMLVFGIAFQMPIAIYFLNQTGLVSIQALRNSRKFVILGVFIVAAMATPPDVISQITLAIPLYVLYELGIVLCWITERRRKEKAS